MGQMKFFFFIIFIWWLFLLPVISHAQKLESYKWLLDWKVQHLSSLYVFFLTDKYKCMNNLLCQFHECLLHPYLTVTAHSYLKHYSEGDWLTWRYSCLYILKWSNYNNFSFFFWPSGHYLISLPAAHAIEALLVIFTAYYSCIIHE